MTKLLPVVEEEKAPKAKAKKLTIKEAAEMWGTSERTARRRLRELRTEAYKPVPDFLASVLDGVPEGTD